MKNIGELMKKAQAVQSQVTILQQKLAKQEFKGEAGNGLVSVVLTGSGVPVSVKINPDIVDKSDVETLEDLILVALKNAKNNADETSDKEMQRIQDSLGLPAGFKLPF